MLLKTPNKKMAQLLLWIYKTKYQGFFYAKCLKRGDGQIRSYRCKISDKYSKGGQLLYDVVQKHLICVMDLDLVPYFKSESMQCRQCRAIFPKGSTNCAVDNSKLAKLSVYRNINLDDLISVSFEGRKFVAIENQEYATYLYKGLDDFEISYKVRKVK